MKKLIVLSLFCAFSLASFAQEETPTSKKEKKEVNKEGKTSEETGKAKQL